jgi:hypothetical protein
MAPKRGRTRRVRVPEALETLTAQEADKLIDRENVTEEAIRRVEQSGIVFLDEIDKVAGKRSAQGPDVSREGVQRDLLPLVEGTTVTTRHGMVRTEHVLFVAAGAFHVSKPSDLMPELQGRFPIRVELDALTEADFVRILEEPRNALTKQYAALLATEGVTLRFPPDGVREVARVAALANASQENIGARRLGTILERVVEEVLNAPALEDRVVIDAAFVRRRVGWPTDLALRALTAGRSMAPDAPRDGAIDPGRAGPYRVVLGLAALDNAALGTWVLRWPNAFFDVFGLAPPARSDLALPRDGARIYGISTPTPRSGSTARDRSSRSGSGQVLGPIGWASPFATGSGPSA